MSARPRSRELCLKMLENDDESDPMFRSAYKTTKPLGKGGMGAVYEAIHLPLGKTVVVKLVHAELAKPDVVERMRVEAQAVAQLSHPNIVVVTDLGTTAKGRPFMVMERLHGRSLGDELKARKFLPANEAIDIACDVLDALGAAHAAGIVHRDVKADNVFLHEPASGTRTTKLIDFGVAKVLATDPSGPPGKVMPSRFATEEGALMGTPRFCSPEQIRGGKVDHRADIYSVGTMLFTMVCGCRPFEQKEILEMLKAHLSLAPPRPSDVAPQAINPALEAVILRALAKDAGDRFQSAKEFARALAEAKVARASAPAWPKTEELPRSNGPPPAAPIAQPASPQGRGRTVRLSAPIIQHVEAPEPETLPRPAAHAPPREELPAKSAQRGRGRARFVALVAATMLVTALAILLLARLTGWFTQGAP